MIDHPLTRQRRTLVVCAIASAAVAVFVCAELALAQSAASSAERVSPGTRDGEAQSYNVVCGDKRSAMVIVNEQSAVTCYYPPGVSPTCGNNISIANAATLACGGQSTQAVALDRRVRAAAAAAARQERAPSNGRRPQRRR